jgi:hypothetical protein
MDPELLRDHLNRLHGELREVQQIDPRSSELLSQVLNDIQRLLAQHGGASAAGGASATDAGWGAGVASGAGAAPGADAGSADTVQPTIPGRLERLAVQFEADHPTLAESSRRLIDLLGKAGL